MNLFNTMNISGSGLTAERMRLDLVSENISNIDTTRTEEGGPYKRKTAVFKEKLQQELSRGENYRGAGVSVDKIVEDNSPPRMVYDPKHTDANEEGFVAKPNVNLSDEVVDMLSASRAYEANISVLNATKQIAMKTLNIGRE